MLKLELFGAVSVAEVLRAVPEEFQILPLTEAAPAGPATWIVSSVTRITLLAPPGPLCPEGADGVVLFMDKAWPEGNGPCLAPVVFGSLLVFKSQVAIFYHPKYKSPG
jgi:hypothetical protein